MMKQEKLVPKRRFEGFNDEWNSKKMKELARFSKGKGYSKRDLVPFGSPIILYGHLYTDYKSYIETVKTYAVKKENSVISQGNEIIVPSSGETAEDIARASAVGIAGIILAGDLNIIKPNSTVDSLFLGLSISNSNLQKELIKRVQGSSVVHLYNSDIEEANLSYPTLKEQQKIGQFFKHLDEMIALQQRKLDKTKSLKSAYLAEMFPAEGERVPKRRFEGFKDEWKIRKIGEVAPLRNGKGFESNNFKNNGVPIIRISNILSSGNIGGIFIYYEEEDNDADYTVPNGAALIAMSGATTGKVSVMKITNYEKVYQNQRVGMFKDLGKVNYKYLITLLQSELFESELMSVLVAGAQPNISSQEINDFEFFFPDNINEQEMIGDFFNNIDNLIATHQQKLEKLKATKQAYLHEMFV